MRKVWWARAGVAALGMGLLCAMLAGMPAWADDARDGTVNPGNAQHLGATDAPETASAPTPAAAANPSGEAENQPQAASAMGRGDATPPDNAAKPSRPHCGTCSQNLKDYEFGGPIQMMGQHPPSVLFYQPLPDVATVLDHGGHTVSANLDWMNLIIREEDSGVLVDYDYEELRSTFDYRQRLGAGEVEARLPVYYRSHGILDHTIEGWHRLFGMNNGLRDAYPEQQFHYIISTRDGLVYNGQSDTVGAGDFSLSYKQPLWGDADSRSAAAWRVAVKAPTGSSNDAYGSGNWDVSAGALWQRQFSRRLRGYVNADYVLTGKPDWPNVRQHNIVHTMWAAEYAWSPRFSLVAQYTTEDSALKTGSFEADKNPRELTIGFHHRWSDKLLWSGGFREDIAPETAPDLTFMSHFKWSY